MESCQVKSYLKENFTLKFPLILRYFSKSIKKLIIVPETSMCFLIQKHAFIQFLHNQKLLILFNQIDVIGGKSLVKHICNP